MKRLMKGLLALCVAFGLAGCSSDSEDDNDAAKQYQSYVQATLDACYLGEIDDLMEICGATEDEANELYESEVSIFAEYLIYFANVDEDYVSDELNESYTQLAKDILAKASYTVNETTEEEGTYYVEVVVSPIDVITDLSTILEDCVNEFNLSVESIGTENVTDDQWELFETTYAAQVYETLNAYVDNIGYLDEESKKLEIKISDDDEYYVESDDWYDVDDLVMGVADFLE